MKRRFFSQKGLFPVWSLRWRRFVFQNQAAWRLRFLRLSGERPGVILPLLTAAAGFIEGVAVALRLKRGNKQP